MKCKTTTVLGCMLIFASAIAGDVAAAEKGAREEQRIVVKGGAPHVAAFTAEKPGPVTYLGVAVAPAGPTLAAHLKLPQGHGLVVTVVEPESPAAKAGLQMHDVLTKLDDQFLIEPRQLSVLVQNRKDGDAVNLTYLRAGAEAQCTATLGTHTPAISRGFQWHRGDRGADVLFRAERFHLPAPTPVLRPIGPEARAQIQAAPQPHPQFGVAGSAGERVMIYRPQAEVVVQDEQGELRLRMNERGRVLKATSPGGEVVFEGPIDTAEQREALPGDLRARLEKFEQLPVLDEPVEPPAGFSPGADVGQMMTTDVVM